MDLASITEHHDTTPSGGHLRVVPSPPAVPSDWGEPISAEDIGRAVVGFAFAAAMVATALAVVVGSARDQLSVVAALTSVAVVLFRLLGRGRTWARWALVAMAAAGSATALLPRIVERVRDSAATTPVAAQDEWSGLVLVIGVTCAAVAVLLVLSPVAAHLDRTRD